MLTKNKIEKIKKHMQIKIFNLVRQDTYTVAFVKFVNQNNIFIQSNYNRNRHTH